MVSAALVLVLVIVVFAIAMVSTTNLGKDRGRASGRLGLMAGAPLPPMHLEVLPAQNQGLAVTSLGVAPAPTAAPVAATPPAATQATTLSGRGTDLHRRPDAAPRLPTRQETSFRTPWRGAETWWSGTRRPGSQETSEGH
jgi:hypothetical protein